MATTQNRSSNPSMHTADLTYGQNDPSSNPAFAHSGANFEGRLSLRGNGTVGSDFTGEIEAAGTVTVDEQGTVKGPIHAREVIVHGVVHGEITADRLLVIAASGRVAGDVRTACIEIERNARIRGRIEMIEPLAPPSGAKPDHPSDAH